MIIFQMRTVDLPVNVRENIAAERVREEVGRRIDHIAPDLTATQKRWITNTALSGISVNGRIRSDLNERELIARVEGAFLLAARERNLGVGRQELEHGLDATLGSQLIIACQQGIRGATQRTDLETQLRREIIDADLSFDLTTQREGTGTRTRATPRRAEQASAQVAVQEPVESLSVFVGGNRYVVDIRPIAGRRQYLPPGDSMQAQLAELVANGQRHGYTVEIHLEVVSREPVSMTDFQRQLNAGTGFGNRQTREVHVGIIGQPRTLVIGPTQSEPQQQYAQEQTLSPDIYRRGPQRSMNELLQQAAPVQQTPQITATTIPTPVRIRQTGPAEMVFTSNETPYQTDQTVAQQFRLSLSNRDGEETNRYVVRIRGSPQEVSRWMADARAQLVQRGFTNPSETDVFFQMANGMQRNIAILDGYTGRRLRIDERDEVLVQANRAGTRLTRDRQTDWES